MVQKGRRQEGQYENHDSTYYQTFPVYDKEKEPASEVPIHHAPLVHADKRDAILDSREHHAAIVTNSKRPPPDTQREWKLRSPERDGRAPWALGRNRNCDPRAPHHIDDVGHRGVGGGVPQEGEALQERTHRICPETSRPSDDQRS